MKRLRLLCGALAALLLPDAVVAQRCQDGHGPPVTVRPLAMQPLADRCPAAQPGHVGLGPVRRAIDSLDRLLFRLTIDEDQARRRGQWLKYRHRIDPARLVFIDGEAEKQSIQ